MNLNYANLLKLLDSQAHVIVYATAQMGPVQDLAAHAAANGRHPTVKGAKTLQIDVLADQADKGQGPHHF